MEMRLCTRDSLAVSLFVETSGTSLKLPFPARFQDICLSGLPFKLEEEVVRNAK